MSREVPSLQGEGFNLEFRFGPLRRMFGLIIGIDKYKSEKIPNLQGCKSDAQSVVDLLSSRFRFTQFHCLTDDEATRSAILGGFETYLIDNVNINPGDAIVVYYAGHGCRADAPTRWGADDNQVETICPHDSDMTDPNGEKIFGIPHRTIGGLLRKLASKKGDNIVCIQHRSVSLPDYFAPAVRL
jgi:hypothetical protein